MRNKIFEYEYNLFDDWEKDFYDERDIFGDSKELNDREMYYKNYLKDERDKKILKMNKYFG